MSGFHILHASRKQSARRRGTILIYCTVALTAFVGLCSLGVDYGRVQLVKTQLQTAADASARAGAGRLLEGPDVAFFAARWCAKKNEADGTLVNIDAREDIEMGHFDKPSKTFTHHDFYDPAQTNAIHVIARRTLERGNAVTLSFASMIGQRTCNVTAEAIAMLVPPININQNVLATANPFLAGMPAGTVASLNNPHNSPDYAGDATNPRQSPMTVNLPLVEGQKLTFDSIDGTARHDPSLAMFSPDGELGAIGHNTNGDEHGIADTNAPINALVGLFLTDAQPDATATPSKLDFTSEASRDFTSLQPQLKQIFFIGDGLNSKGQQQEFIVPKGATRLFLATWDFYEWNNNFGGRMVKVSRPQQVVLVK
jgi:hypothetical protein